MDWTQEATNAANFLASLPTGNTVLKKNDLRSLMLNTGGNLLARGRLYDIVSRSLGAGVYRVNLRATNP